MDCKLEFRCQQPTKELLDGRPYKFIDNGSKVLAVAHCDSVRAGSHHYVETDKSIYCTSLDDRLGVFIILDILPRLGIKTDILLTDDEEVGDSTAQLFETDKKYNWMFQFDRRGTDAVVYKYENMIPFAKRFFKVGWGTFSDICYLDHLGCAGINIGTGYYKEHTKQSYAVKKEVKRQLERFIRFYFRYKDVFIPGIDPEDRIDSRYGHYSFYRRPSKAKVFGFKQYDHGWGSYGSGDYTEYFEELKQYQNDEQENSITGYNSDCPFETRKKIERLPGPVYNMDS